MQKRKYLVKIARALLGETRIGAVGAFLQWLALSILISQVLLAELLAPWIAISLSLVGVAILGSGIILAFRGQSLGPIVVMPALLGIAILVILTVLLYPVRWLTKNGSDATFPDQ